MIYLLDAQVMKSLKSTIDSHTEFRMTFLILTLKLATHCSLGPKSSVFLCANFVYLRNVPY